MNKVNREAIKQLLESEDSATLSLYFPTHRFPSSEHISEDRTRLKNLIRSGKEALQSQGIETSIIGQITTELEEDIYENNDFWQHTTEGMAVFCSPAGVQFFHLPIECGEYCSAGDQYDIAPLLVAASCDRPYHLLALAVRNPVLFYGDMYGIERVDIDLPESPEKALNIDELFSNSQTARSGSYGAGNPGTKSHGQGDSRQAGQEERLKFFRLIDDKIQSSKITNKNIPVLLAGTDDEVSSYRETSRMKHLLESSLSGNSTETPSHEIHRRSWPLVAQELCDPERINDVEKVQSLLGTGRASIDTDAVAAAAAEGRVDTLLVGMLTKTNDSISDVKGAITKLIFSDKQKADKISPSVRSVFDQGGRIVGMLKDAMPSGAVEAAIYRY